VAAHISNFISFEVVNPVEMLCQLGFSPASRLWAGVAVFRMKTVIYVAPEVGRAMKPLPGADESATSKPFRA